MASLPRVLLSSGVVRRSPIARMAAAIVLLHAVGLLSPQLASCLSVAPARTAQVGPDAPTASKGSVKCPSYFLLGAQKCGTTSLAQILKSRWARQSCPPQP